MIHLTNAQRLAEEAMAVVLTPPPPVDYLQWAEDNIVFSPRESPQPGPYNRTLFPEFDEILRALSPEDPCRTVTVAKSAQLGGTVLLNIFTLGTLEMDPGDFLVTHPTDDNARRWSKTKLKPMLRNTVSLQALFPERSRDTADSVMYKERADGRGALLISGANSPASLSQVTMKRQAQDDLAKWNTNTAGDPESQADTRSKAHEFAKILKISTPLVWPGCRITKNLKAGSYEEPEVPCPQCERYQVLHWDNMLQQLDESHPEAAHFTCIDCGFPIEEHHRPWMKARMRWTARYPERQRVHRSFWIWCAYSTLMSFERIARSWLEAKGDPAAEQVFYNDTAGLAFEVDGEAVSWEILRDRASESHYARGQIPLGALVTTLGIDCQGDRVEWQLVGWGPNIRRWVIEYGVFPGHISSEACQKSLDGLMKMTWPNAVGRRIGVDMAAIDGNAWTEDVWSWVKRWPASQVIMVRGANTETAPLLQRVKRERNTKTGKLLRYSRRFFNFATSVLKMALYRNTQKVDPLERGYIAFPRGLEDEFYRQLTAERRKGVKNKSGFMVFSWVKDPNQANEGLDTHLQAEAAAIKMGVRSQPDAWWAALEAARETPELARQLDLEDLIGPVTSAPEGQGDANPVRTPPAPAKPKLSLAEMAARMNGR